VIGQRKGVKIRGCVEIFSGCFTYHRDMVLMPIVVRQAAKLNVRAFRQALSSTETQAAAED